MQSETSASAQAIFVHFLRKLIMALQASLKYLIIFCGQSVSQSNKSLF